MDIKHIRCIALLLFTIWHCSAKLSCPDGKWGCLDGSKCIDESWVCNRGRQCGDRSDEDPVMCAQWNCTAGYQKCTDGMQCVRSSKICREGEVQCQDGSDQDPALCAHYQCPAGYWKCKDTLQCIEEKYVCDNFYMAGCNDKSDEDPVMCAQWDCPAGRWKCNDGLQCVLEEILCPFLLWSNFCNDKSDTDPAMCDNRYKQNCTSGYRKCAGESYCRPEHLMCDGTKHCKHGSDEDPVMCAESECSYGHWRCADGLQCLPINWVCDGNPLPTYGCRDGSDEDPALCIQWDCNHAWVKHTQACENVDDCAYTKCADNLQCINRKSICDGEFDCKDRSDELCNDGCHITPLKPEEEDIVRICQEDLSRCFSVKQSCDGIAQCPEASDETQSGCTCEDWGLKSCINNGTNSETYCLNANWVRTDVLNQSASNCKDILHHIDSEMKMIEYYTGLYYGHSGRSHRPIMEFNRNLLTICSKKSQRALLSTAKRGR